MAQTLDFNNLLPAYLKNEVLSSLVSNLFNRFVSDESSVLVAGRIGTQVAGDATIVEPDLERQENALIPGLYFQAGTEQYLFTFDDFVNKMNTLDIDVGDLRTWIQEQTFNYSPPIDYDKFVNYTNYFWVGSAYKAGTGPSWNPNFTPEYYVIARPKPTDSLKMPVQLATTRDINLYYNDRSPETFTLTFTSATAFTITSNLDPNVFAISGTISTGAGVGTAVTIATNDTGVGPNPPSLSDGARVVDLCTFTITNGADAFAVGDKFIITIEYFTSNTSATFEGAIVIGKGTVTGINSIYLSGSLPQGMYIDGVAIASGNRILVKNQTDPTQNGIYIATAGAQWQRAPDMAVGQSYSNMTIYVAGGSTQSGYTYTFTSSANPAAVGTDQFPFTLASTTAPIPINQWQEFNYWIHRDDIALYADVGFTIDTSTQAQVPIIEYPYTMQLNAYVDGNGNPASATTFGVANIPQAQVKTRFNQIPQFDLFRYDGTHAGCTSGIWFYAEGPNYETDSVLLRRVVLTDNGDYVFGAGIADALGRILYWKDSGALTSIWQPGVATSTASTPLFIGAPNKGVLNITSVAANSDNQQWVATAVTPTIFSIVGSRSGNVGQATVNVPFITDELELTLNILTGNDPFAPGEYFTFNIYAPTAPRYVEQLPGASFVGSISGIVLTVTDVTNGVIKAGQTFSIGAKGTIVAEGTGTGGVGTYYLDTSQNLPQSNFTVVGSIINYPGGYNADHAAPEVTGCWLTPSRMFQNLNRQTETQISYGDFLNHGISVIAWQEGFTGASFGDNNVRMLDFNPGLGGQIREFGSNFPLLASMLIEQDLSPITIIDFAEQQYNLALSSIDQFMLNNLAIYLSSVGTIETSTINPNAADILSLMAYFEQLRGLDANLTTVFGDSTAAVKNWPATLPYLGLLPKVQPGITFDQELNSAVIIYHDGHTAVIATDNPDNDRALVRTIVPRSDGTSSPGVFSETVPSLPYARQLWLKPSTFTLSVFDVSYDTTTAPPTATAGQYWYNRSTNTLYQYSGIAWVITGNLASRWIPFSLSAVRNSLVLAIENKLYNGVHPQQQINLLLQQPAVINSPYAALELAQFSAEYNYDTFAPDYVPGNAFTWNYKQATIAPLTTVPARWYDIYKAYFGSFGPSVFPTDRPDIQPWKLMGFDSAPSNFIATYGATQYPIGGPQTTVQWLATSNISLIGLQVIDGNSVSTGDRVLVIGQSLAQFNGIYIASSSGWSRAGDTITTTMNVYVNGGYAWNGTTWTLTTASPVIGTTALTFEQVRMWQPTMWATIQAAQPTMQLCVNINTDGLIPPYVSPTQFASGEALLTSIPPGVNLGYTFGDNGPVELVWTKSLEYNYGLARSYFRLFPLQFLDASWGETYIAAGDNLRVERNLQASLPSSKFLLHGERLNVINTYTPAEVQARFINATNGIVWSQTFGGTVVFEVTHTANTGAVGPMGSMGPSSTVFNVYVNGNNIGLIYEGVPFSFSSGGVTYTNVTIEDFGIPFEMGDTFTMTFVPDKITVTVPTTGTNFVYGILGCEGCVADATPDPSAIVTDVHFQPTYSHTPAQTKIFNGLGQWFTDLLRYTYIDTDVSTAALAYRGWDVDLVHRMGALIRPDTIDINTYQGDMPVTGYNIILKRSMNTADLWITGLRVQLVQMGKSTLTQSGLFVPVGNGSDWIFRVSGYNSANPQVDYYQYDTSGNFQDFIALGGAHTGIAWNHYTTETSTANTTLPIQITGVQNVLNFLFGYADYIQDQGFKINANDTPITDQQTGRNLDWQLEIEKFIDQVYAGMNAGDAYVLNPFMNALYLQTPTGLMGRYTTSMFIDVASTQACYDVTGSAIPLTNLRVIRTDEQTVTYSTTPIFSAHVFIDQFEHAILFNDNFTSDPTSALIFNPFLGEYLATAYLTFTRQDTANGKPTFDGFYLSGNTVQRNMVSSVAGISQFYDAGQTFNNPTTATNALSLLGFQQPDYFTNLDISPATQLDFWRGMIHAKGTNLAVQAFTNYKAFYEAAIDEYWAYKVATYGDAREDTMPEIKINPSDCAQNYTQLQFYSAQDTTYNALSLYIQVEANDDTRWFTIDDLGTTLRFDAAAVSEQITVAAAGYYALKNIYHNGDSFAPTVTGPAGCRIVTANMIYVTQAGTYTISGYTWLNQTKFSPVKLFNYVSNTLVDQVTLWHPAIGIHAYEALETINIQTNYDPANYNYTTNVTDNPNYKSLKPWADREVGRVWWNTSNLDYIPYYDATIFPDRQTRQTRWGALADYASIDLYVWTESEYAPSEYNAQAALQAGDSTIDPSVRLSGTVGFTNYYSANRVITIMPIAWSEAGVGNGNAHPAFGPAYFTKVYNAGTNLIADTGRLSDINIVAGRNFGGWNMLTNVPIGEVTIGTNVSYDIGSSLSGPSAPIYVPVTVSSGTISSFSISGVSNSTIFGTRIGQIQILDNNGTYLRLMDSTGFYQDLAVSAWTSTNLSVNSTITFSFDQFGLQLTATRSTTGTITAADLITALTGPANDVFVRELVNYTPIIALPDVVFDNNPNDIPAAEYGWKTWVVPTQAQLTADLVPPNNQWLPYLGVPVTITVTAQVAAAMASSANTWTLPSGITVNRYTSTWTAWAQLTDTVITSVSNGTSQVSFTLSDETTLDVNRLSVYSNGIQLNPASYVISGNVVQVVNTLPEGTTVRLLYRAYQPTASDLAFDPLVSDNPTIQTWYKLDYQYTEIIQRDSTGAITGTKYYFWVTGKTDPLPNQSLNLVEAAELLESGEDTYMLFSRIVADINAESGAGYDSCAIYGLGTQVTAVNQYKLRFLRNFTLIDDPEQIDLKNVHTEWTLIRQNQSKNIPTALWTVLTNAACGQDPGGNQLPSQTRIDYDNKYGTQTQFGFGPGQIFAPQALILTSIVNTILNTSVTINVGPTVITDYITALGINSSTTEESLTAQYFSSPAVTRATMSLILASARAAQINEIFFNALNDALANNYQMTDIFKTSMLTVNSSTIVNQATQTSQINEFY